MIYKAIGVMSGSSLDGLDIAMVSFTESGGQWAYEILHANCKPFPADLRTQLQSADQLSARAYHALDTSFGTWIGNAVNEFIEQHQLFHQVHLVASHGHTVFHEPGAQTSVQVGSGAAIAAVTGLPVVNQLRSLDVALGGQGAPIVPIGEKLLLGNYPLLLNLGGIANVSINQLGSYQAFDIAVANQVLNRLAAIEGWAFDKDGALAATGQLNQSLLQQLNQLDYYSTAAPKSLNNQYIDHAVWPMIEAAGLPIADSLHTYCVHLAGQIAKAVSAYPDSTMLVTGGGAFNGFLMEAIKRQLGNSNITVEVPNEQLVQYKEALVMALMGILRWREEANVLASVTGARYNSSGGALWLGGDA